jgi:hypothetical protein
MTDNEKKLEALLEKNERTKKQIHALKLRLDLKKRKSDNHLKLALGGSLLTHLEQKAINLNGDIKAIFDYAHEGLEKEGLARERYNAIIEAYKPK